MGMLFLKNRFVYEGEDGGGGGAPATSPAGTPSPTPDPHAGVPASATPPAGNPPPPARPDWLPEKFWDKTKNEANYQNLATSYAELERRHFMRTDDLRKELTTEVTNGLLKDRPESPDQYLLEPPKNFLPEGLKFEANKDDPLFKTFLDIAHKRGMSQDEVSTVIGAYLESMALQQTDPAQEIKSLGQNARERIEQTRLWSQANIPKEMFGFVGQQIAKTAEGIKFLEWVMQAAGEPRQGDLSIGGTSQGNGQLTAEQLTQMQADPRYYDPNKRDPAFVKRIEAGWKALAGS